MYLETLDLAVVAIYAVLLIMIANFVSREKAGHEKDTSDYFLAGRALPWWAIGASLIAANISAEQIDENRKKVDSCNFSWCMLC